MTVENIELHIVGRVGHPDFLDLPWGVPLDEWDHPRMVKMAHGASRHIVRFVRYNNRVYALKETELGVAQEEFDILRELRADHLPVVDAVGVVSWGEDGRAMLITRYLDFSLPYLYILGRDEPALANNLINAAVVLLVRLHLNNVFWGDCSLSNILLRRDAGAFMAYMVDAETAENRATISDAMREYDMEIAEENVVGGLIDLQIEGRVPEEVDPFEVARTLRSRYESLWAELHREEEFSVDERWRIDHRVRAINELGFDVEELSISRNGERLKIKPILVEEGHHIRSLRRRTGLEVQENQARRLLGDIAQHRAWLSHEAGKPVPEAVAAAQWLANVYEPVVESIPPELLERLEPPEVFHQLLEHRYYLSMERDAEVSYLESIHHYIEHILVKSPQERQVGSDDDLA